MHYYFYSKKCVTISRVHSLFHCLQILSPTVSISIGSSTFSSIHPFAKTLSWNLDVSICTQNHYLHFINKQYLKERWSWVAKGMKWFFKHATLSDILSFWCLKIIHINNGTNWIPSTLATPQTIKEAGLEVSKTQGLISAVEKAGCTHLEATHFLFQAMSVAKSKVQCFLDSYQEERGR